MLKKIALVCGVTLVLSVLAVAVAGMGVSAKAAGAIVIKNGGCEVLDGNENGVAASGDRAVLTPSGNSKITCTVADVIPSSTGKAVRWNFSNTGQTCTVELSFPNSTTTDWQEVVTPSGQATLTCHVNGQSR